MALKKLDYILGLDCGITSVGFAILPINKDNMPYKIQRLGIRLFDICENKQGATRATVRREARLARRVNRRKKYRIKKLKKYLLEKNILTQSDFINHSLELKPLKTVFINTKSKDIVFSPIHSSDLAAVGIWGWRVYALDYLVNKLEWAHILLHILKHRGFLYTRKNEAKTSNDQKT